MAPNNSKFSPELRKPGDLILYEDWNAAMQEIVRLESDKVNRQGGDSLQGPLTIEAALAVDSTSTISVELEVKGALKLAEGVAINQFSNDGSLSENSDSIVPTQKAVRTYVDTAQKAVETYVDNAHKALETAHKALETYVDTLAKSVVFKGMILMWSGKAQEIPTGWVLCDGNNGTPNLTDKFIVGAGNSYAIGATGGADSVTLLIEEIPAHNHLYYTSFRHSVQSGRDTDCMRWDGFKEYETTSSGGNKPHENRPPYYALAFIMKL